MNAGPNTGHAVLHSGTVGAALTARTFARPAAAFSLGVSSFAPVEPHWATAEAIARRVIAWLVARHGPTADHGNGHEGLSPTVLNVNVPNLAPGQIEGPRRARLARFGAVQASVAVTGAGNVRLDYEAVAADHEPGTDAALLAAGVACFTPLEGVAEATDPPKDSRRRLSRPPPSPRSRRPRPGR